METGRMAPPPASPMESPRHHRYRSFEMRRLFYSDLQSDRVSLGLLLLRVVVGAAFMFHGLPKIKNPTDWMDRETTTVHGSLQAAAAVSEFAGGAMLILGLFTRVAATALGITMAV